MKQKLDDVTKDNATLRAALLHIRQNPEQLLHQVNKKRGWRGRRKDNESSSGDDKTTQSGMISNSKSAVKAVYRTIKFINNETQEQHFYDAVMDNLGMADLLYDRNDDTDEGKARVAANREEVIDGYSQFWKTYLNDHRTYVQVSSTLLPILTLRVKF
jgi:hypothetical protein